MIYLVRLVYYLFAGAIVPFVLTSFVAGSANPADWGVQGRVSSLFAAFMCAFVALILDSLNDATNKIARDLEKQVER